MLDRDPAGRMQSPSFSDKLKIDLGPVIAKEAASMPAVSHNRSFIRNEQF